MDRCGPGTHLDTLPHRNIPSSTRMLKEGKRCNQSYEPAQCLDLAVKLE